MPTHTIDIIILVVLLYAVYKGYRNGLVVELCGILGIIIGAYTAHLFTEKAISYFKISGSYSYEIIFFVILIAVVIIVGILARLVSKVLSFTGLGIANSLLGCVASAIKTLLVVSILLSLFDFINSTTHWVKRKDIEQSRLYNPVKGITSIIFPYIESATVFYDQTKQIFKPNEQEIAKPDSSKTEEELPRDSILIEHNI